MAALTPEQDVLIVITRDLDAEALRDPAVGVARRPGGVLCVTLLERRRGRYLRGPRGLVYALCGARIFFGLPCHIGLPLLQSTFRIGDRSMNHENPRRRRFLKKLPGWRWRPRCCRLPELARAAGKGG